jgi:hypothetical protein
MVKLKNKEMNLSIIVDQDNKVDINNNMKISKELNIDFFQNLKVSEDGDMPSYTTPIKYLVIDIPIRRAAQLLSKKIAVTKNMKSIDGFTGQVTGDSQASKLTQPELSILLGTGLNDSLVELLKSRGGDLQMANAMNALLYKQGDVNQETLDSYASGVVSTKTLNSYFNGMMIKTTL